MKYFGYSNGEIADFMAYDSVNGFADGYSREITLTEKHTVISDEEKEWWLENSDLTEDDFVV